MNLTTKTIEYNFESELAETDEYGDLMRARTATIIFERNENRNENFKKWKFVQCKYSGLSFPHTEEDWDFLKEVVDKIKELKKELNK